MASIFLICRPARSEMRGARKGTRITVTYRPAHAKPALKEMADLVSGSRMFDDVIAALDDYLALPHPISVVFASCEEANAFFDPRRHQILLCYELLSTFHRNFSRAGFNRDETDSRVIYATLFTLLHELGHALLSELHVSPAGNEEDQVDEIGVWLALEMGRDGERVLISTLDNFSRGDSASRVPRSSSDPHSPDMQRLRKIVCLMYGAEPAKFSEVAENAGLERTERKDCALRYRDKKRRWDNLLSQHLQ